MALITELGQYASRYSKDKAVGVSKTCEARLRKTASLWQKAERSSRMPGANRGSGHRSALELVLANFVAESANVYFEQVGSFRAVAASTFKGK